jgi:hypothetical protein
MSYTLAEVNRLSTDRFIQGVAEDVVRVNPILSLLPVENVTGTQVTWNRESTSGTLTGQTATFSQIGGTLGESTPSTTQVSAVLAQMTDSARIPVFGIEVKGDINDLETFTHDLKIKALFDTFGTAMLYGDNSVNSNEFDGLHSWVDNTLDTDLDISESSSPLNISNLDQMMSAVRQVTHILSNRNIHNRMSQAQYLGGSVGSATAQNLNVRFGERLRMYGNSAWIVTDFITQTETDADPPVETGGSDTSVIALNLGGYSVMGSNNTLYAQGPTIIQSARGPHMTEPIRVPGEANIEFQYYWFVGLITPARRTIGRVRGATNAAIAN